MIRAVFINLPTIAFLLLFHFSDNRLEAAFVGMFLAWAVILSGQRQPAVVRGLNLHFAFIVPSLYLLWRHGADPVASWIETWVLATVVWAAAGSVAYAVWRGALPSLMGFVAVLSFGWTLFQPDDQLLMIGVPVIIMSLTARWLGRGDVNLLFLATSMATDVDETAA